MRLPALLLGFVLSLAGAGAAAQPAPSQKPLIARDGGSVKPNVVLTLDTSGSMINQYLPSGAFRVGAYTVTFSNDYGGVIMHPSDPRTYAGNFRGTVPADPDDASNVLQRQMRSADVNSLYYNPEVLYLPWYEAAGNRRANANPAAAPFDPYGWTTAATADLTAAAATVTLSLATNGRAWCTQIDPAVEPAHGMTCTAQARKFSPGLYYRLQREPGGAFKDPNAAANYQAFDINNPPVGGFTRYPARTDCAGAACTQAEERQNFANWFVFYRSRLLLAQTAIPEAFVSQGDTLRLGWGVLNKPASDIDGQQTAVLERGVRDYTAAQKPLFFNFLRNRNVDGFTPLRQAMYGVGQYFSRTDHRGPYSDDPSQPSVPHAHKTCRRNYHLLVTDGYWNNQSAPLVLPADVGNSDNQSGAVIVGPNGQSRQYVPEAPYRDDRYNQEGDSLGTLADVAMHFWKRDLRPDLDNKVGASTENPAFWQHMVNFTVGLGVKGTLDPAMDLPALTAGTKAWGTDRIDDLWHAALNSRGAYFSARTPAELAASMRAALEKTGERELKESGVATAAATLQDNNRKYVPRYRSGTWVGDVEAFNLNASGEAAASPLWSAQARLPAWADRRIVTWDAGLATPQGVTFTWATLSAGNRTALGPLGSQGLVDFIRGDRSGEGPAQWRTRQSLLGDFVNTTPVFAKRAHFPENASLPVIGSTYTAYWNTTKSNRDGVLYIGGNAGMLHGFRDTNGVSPGADGTEVFAYVPRAVYASLPKLASRSYGTLSNYHSYFVDGPLREADVHVIPPAGGPAQWRNYLLGSTGAGARAVFALDVTDPAALGAAAVRWEISDAGDADLGYVLFPLGSGVLPNGQWVALFGNGYGSTTQKAFLFVVNMQTGAFQKVAVAPAVANNGLGGVAVVRGAQGYIEGLYAGDLQGNLWKFAVNLAAPSGFEVANGGTALFTARDAGGTPQPILQPPVLFSHSAGGRIVVFGTGRLITEADADSTAMQTLYGVRDNPPESLGLPLTRAHLASRSIVTVQGTGAASQQTFFSFAGDPVNWAAQRGWVIDLAATGYSGLRMVYPPQAPTSRFAYISTVSPAQNLVVCDETFGRAIDFVFPVETGLDSPQNVLDTTGDGVMDMSDMPVSGFATRADGAKTLVAGPRTTPATGGPCQRFVSLNTVDKTDLCLPSAAVAGIRDRTWRRLVNPPLR
jgi:type IV pilus assembly protein PilY1